VQKVPSKTEDGVAVTDAETKTIAIRTRHLDKASCKGWSVDRFGLGWPNYGISKRFSTVGPIYMNIYIYIYKDKHATKSSQLTFDS